MKRKISIALMLAILLISNFGVLINIQTAFASTADGVVATWHLDEGIGSVASDSSGFGNGATLSGGKFGNALYFDGDNDYVEVAFDSTIDFTAPGQDFSAEAWINIEVAQDYNVIFQQEDTSIPGRSWLYIRYNGALRSFIGGIALETAGGYITLGNWHHVALSFDKEDGSQTGQLTLYVDGALIVSEERTLEPSTGDYRIGIHKNDIHDTTGRIDEVRLSDIARTIFSQIIAPSDDGNVAALWHFDESVGTEVYDEVNGNTGYLVGDTAWAGPTWVNGVFGKALHFDGVDDYATAPHSASLDVSGTEITLEAWVNAEAFPTGRIINIAKQGAYALQVRDGRVQVYLGPGPTQFYTDPVLSINTWYHLAATYDGSKIKIYVDGALEAETNIAGAQAQSINPLFIGHNQAQNGPFEGIIDEPRIWNTALSAEEIKKHAWGLVGEWLFNESGGSMAYDTSGFSHPGTIMGSPTWSTGKVGGALTFDGASYVNLGESVDDVINEEITLEAWIRPETKQRGGIISNDVTYYSPHNGFDFFLWDDDVYGRLYLDYGDGTSLGRMWYSIPSMDWYSKWHHVAGTWDGSTMRLYVDGVEVPLLGFTGPYEDSVRNNLVGAISYSSVLWKFNGAIDEVRIWNKALLPITFDQTGLNSAAQSELVVTINDPIPLNYEDLPFIMMVPSGTEVTYEYEDPVEISPTVGFTLLDVTGPESPVTVNEPTIVTGNYFEWARVVASKHDTLGNPLSGWTMNLAGPDAQSADTGLDGTVAFTVKQPGGYHVSENLEAGYTLVTPASNDYALTVAAGCAYGPYDFVNFQWMTISGNKYELAYCDDFEDGESSDWTPVNGIWDVLMEDGDYAYRQSGIQYIPGIRVTGDSSWDDYVVEAKVKSTGTTAYRYGGLLLRVANPGTAGTAGTYYELYLQEGGRLQLVRTESGTRTAITNPIVGPYYNEWWNIKAQVIGDNIKAKAWEVGTPEPTDWIIDWTDPTPISTGKIGLITFHFTDLIYNQEPVYFDDICIKIPLSGWDMSLYSQSDLMTAYDTDTTDEYGYYEFTVRDPDTYNIYEFLEEGWTELYPEYVLGNGDNELGYTGITVANGVDQTGFDFVNFKWATISGHKYEQIYCDDFDSTLAGTDPMYWSEHGVGTWYVEKDASAPSQGPEGYGDVYVGDASSTLYTRDFSFITLAPDFSNGVFEFKFKLDSTSTPTPRITIPVRYQDDSNWVLFDIDTGVYRTGYYIFSTESGWTELAGKSASITKDAWHTMKIVLDDWNYEMWIDGVLELTAYDSTEAFSSGKIGLGVYRNTVARFDDVCLLEPLSGWDMSLYSQSDLMTAYDTDTTDEYGYYEFTVRDPDTYNIYEFLEEGWTELYPMYIYGNDQEELGYTGITVASGVDQKGFDFVNFEWVTIYGHKYFDGNGNGEWNNDEPYLDGWTIKLNDDAETVVTGPDGAPSWTTGYYSFLIKDPGVCKVSEETPDWWTKTEPTGDYHTVIVQSGTNVELNFGNWLGPSWVSTSCLCNFDMDEADGKQFRIIFTPDVFNDPNEYKVSATNPGQFYYNVFHSGEITSTFTITLPDDFETQGANPVHVYNSLNAGPYGCLIPGEDVSDLFIIDVGDVITVTPIEQYDGFIYINVHCEYTPEQTGGYEQIYYDDNGVTRGHATIDDADPPTIPDLCDHDFNVVLDGVIDDTVTVESRNVFKKIRGIVGFVKVDGSEIEDVAVTIEGPSAYAELTTDVDGFYGYDFFHKGKPATYTVHFEYDDGVSIDDIKEVTLKAGHFAEVSYLQPP